MRRATAIPIATIALVAAGAILSVSSAAPPANADGRFGDWFRSLRTPAGESCCDLSDCRRTRTRPGPLGYQAQTPAGEWVDIPPDRILQRENPTGEPVMCWLPTRGVICFVRGVEA